MIHRALITAALLLACAAPRVPAQSIDEVLPPDTPFLLAIEDAAAFCGAFRATPLGRVLDEPDVAEFLEMPLSALSERLCTDFGLPPLEALAALDCRRLFFAVTRGAKDDFCWIAGIEGRDGFPEQLDLAAERSALKAERPVFRARAGGLLLLSSSEAALEAVTRRAAPGAGIETLASAPRFAAARQALGGAAQGPRLYLDVQSGLDLLSSLAPDGALPAGVRAFGLDAIDVLAVELAAQDGCSCSRTYIGLCNDASVIRGHSPDEAFDKELLALVPIEAVSFQFFSLAPASLLDAARPLGLEPPDAVVALLDAVGPRFLALVAAGVGRPDLLIAVEARDAQDLHVALARLIALAGAGPDTSGGVQVKTIAADGVDVHEMFLGQEVPFTLCLAAAEGWLVAATSRALLKKELDLLHGTGNDIRGSAAFREVWDARPQQGAPVLSVGSNYLPRSFRFVHERLALALAQHAASGSWPAVDESLLPSCETVAQRLAPSLCVTRRLEKAWLFECHGTPGAELTGAGAAVGVLAVLAGIVVREVLPMLEAGRVNAARAQIEALKGAVFQYYLNNNRLPESLDVLTQPDPKNLEEPYLEDPDSLFDPWGNPFDYRVIGGRKYVITSFGADGQPGGTGANEDISSARK